MSGWQPMETAPRDGTEFLIWCRAKHTGREFHGGIAYYSDDGFCPAVRTHQSRYGIEVRAWHPLPEPPDE